ncbi:two-component sensor histidine kinase [Streptomyces venezuelae]|uniref:histidine kinase n=1 Tax=Streptomyces venezuelae TaxID=54571 RepID=A0A5P2D2Y1_STRVZ|nr:histidine kinase [Streptomyces venezuelae]QES49103.1 two-component sensor histidine kinase [Streptomyces venezuelae]
MISKLSAGYGPSLALGAVLLLVASVRGAPAAGTLLGVGVLLPLLALTARWSPRPWAWAGCCLGGAAVAYWPVSLMPDAGWPEAAGAALFWALPAAGASGAGAYLRRQAGRSRRAVVEARREQQLELARDLHDFVAHDVSAIVVQAQAARFVAEQDPRHAVAALERIEAAGLNALATMDRTVHALRAAGGGPTAPTPGLAELPALVGRFEGGVLEADPVALAGLSREADSTAYRVVVEALTNVRRHAPGAALVTVAVRRAGAGIELSVANSAAQGGGRGRWARRRSGTGLEGLRGRVEAAEGTLTAGAVDGGGWLVRAVFPAVTAPQG